MTERYSDDDARCQFDLYPGSRQGPILVFVHGGAWRSEDKSDHADLARRLVAATGCPVAVPNYRLTPADNTDPRFQHPAHAHDLLRFLRFLRTWPAPPCALDTDSLVLIAHSCSAHMLASILLAAPYPALAPDAPLAAAVRGVVASEGIYDLDALLARFPAYRAWFVQPAFGPGPAYPAATVVARPPRPGAERAEWLLVHSRGDSLVDAAQSERMHAGLAAAGVPARLCLDLFAEEHDEVLRAPAYVPLVAQFAARLGGFSL